MRDFRDAKAMARTLRAGLAATGRTITIGESLELIAKAFGMADWNTLAAAIKAAEAAPEAQQPVTPSAPSSPAPTRGLRFSDPLQASLHRSIGLANARGRERATLEHLLLALTDDPDAVDVMRACEIDPGALAVDLTRHVDNDLQTLGVEGAEGGPTPGYHRVMQRAVIHVQSAGRDTLTGANVLDALFSEQESQATQFLLRQGMSRLDAWNFIAHGIRKSDAPRSG